MAGKGQQDLLHARWHQWIISKTPGQGEVVRDHPWTGNNSLQSAVLLEDVDAVLREAQHVNINDVNTKGETPLHIASGMLTQVGANILEILLSKGADVNCQNKWGQTPLHYAAIADFFENLQKLIVANVDVNIVDLNGYNALHCLICSGKDPSLEFFEDTDEQEVCSDLKKAMHALVNAGTKINCQTKCGHTILHLASTRDYNTPLLKYILQNFPEIDMKAKNEMGENFLHVYVGSEIFEEVSDVLDEIAVANLPIRVRELLNDRNVLGRTPWTNMVDNANVSEEFVKKILSYGISVNTVDNLGNTVLHRIAGVSTGIVYSGIIDLLIEAGADINALNVYRESPGFVLWLRDVFEVFTKHEMDFNTLDRWGRSPLVSVMKHRPIPDLLRKLVEDGKADVNARDVYGSTPLHFAAYHNYPEQVELLLNAGADKDAIDVLQDRPLDTARRHCSFRCHHILDVDDGSTSEETPKKTTFAQILLDIPRMIPSSKIKSAQDVQTLLGIQETFDGFIDHLMTTYYFRQPEAAAEVDTVVSAVNSLVESLAIKIASYDSRFEMSVFPTGSSAEGTKVGRPDEFDFVLCLDKLNDKTEILMTEECQETGYVCLRFTETSLSRQYLPFCDKDGYFLALPFLQLFFRYARRALNETDLWTSGNLYYNFEDKMEVLHGKPVFNFSVYWIGSIYKQLKISIDLVPAVYKRGWWPPNINVQGISLMNASILGAGCFLMLQTRTQDFDTKRHLLNDSISHTCNVYGNQDDNVRRRMLRISATPAEISLMKSLPEKLRHAYALAKIVKTKDVCPEIEIDKLPTKLYSRQKKFQERTPLPVKPSELIKSYMLKNCAFYVLQEMHPSLEHDSDLKISEIAAKLYMHLLLSVDQRRLKPYFLPFSDIFESEKDSPKSSYTEFMLHLKRELSLKLILGILNHPFPEVCLASKTEGITPLW